MCVRYTLHQPDAAIAAVARALGIQLDPRDWMAPRYNVAPTHEVPVVAIERGTPRLAGMRWGLVPPDDRGMSERRLLTNARSETLARLPAFRDAAALRRCAVPVNGFYEFRHVGKRRDPFVFMTPDGSPFALAGLWEPALEDLPATFCIVTTEPNSTVAPYHNRMPLVLRGEAIVRWTGDQPLAPASLLEFSRPGDPGALVPRAVNRYVNDVRHEGPQCLDPAEPDLPELF